MITRKIIDTRWLWLYYIALFNCAPIFAQPPTSPNTKTPATLPKTTSEKEATKGHALTTDDLQSFFDGFLPLQIGQAGIPGVVIAVVKDSQLIFANGYGYADKEKKVPISPKTTLFRPGSISKLFTWTAVMQQVEMGKLDLDRDVNDYLDFRIPPTFDKPITLRDIMTHRPGFEETIKGSLVSSAEDLHSISHYLREHLPARIFPPGTTPAYSNYAATLAAYLVERVSGQSFNDYVEEHLFKPLDMNHSTFRQPVPDAFKPLMSNGYIFGSNEPKPFELLEDAPAGSLSASAVDISHFMIMHLQNGRYGNTQILKPETVAQMHARQEGWPKAMHAMCLGFYEQSENDHRVIGHGGDTQLFHSELSLILDANVGLFVSYNSQGKHPISSPTLFNKFMDRYFPEIPQKEPEWPTADRDASNVIGTYESSRRFETNILAVTSMISQANVTVDSKNKTLSMTGFDGLDQQPLRFREIAPMIFRDVDGKAKIAFVKDANRGHVMYTDYPFMVSQQVNNPLNKQSVNYFIIGFSLSVIVLTLIMWPIAAMIRKHYSKPLMLEPNAKRLRLITRLLCLIIIVYTIGVMIFFIMLFNNLNPAEQNDSWLHLLQIIGLATGLGSLVVIYNSIKSWEDKQQWLWSKIWNTLLALACVGFFWFITHWHLLNLNLNY